MFNETLLLLDSIASTEFITGDSFEDILRKASEFYLGERTGAYISSLDRMGDPNSNKIWVLIGRYHEEILKEDEILDGYIPFDIGLIVFADTEEEAKKIIKTHPTYLQDVQDTIEAFYYDDDKGQVELHEMDVLDWIFGDTGQKLAQLCGSFIEVPVEYHYLFRQ